MCVFRTIIVVHSLKETVTDKRELYEFRFNKSLFSAITNNRRNLKRESSESRNWSGSVFRRRGAANSVPVFGTTSSSSRSPRGPLHHSTVATVDTGVPIVTRWHSDVIPELTAPSLSWTVFSERELKFTFAICRRPSVCLSSVVCLSVAFVRPTQAIEIFGTVSSPFGTLAIC